VYNELRDNSRKQVATTVFAAVTLCAGVYEYVGTIGYVMFGSRAADQILKNRKLHYSQRHDLSLIALQSV